MNVMPSAIGYRGVRLLARHLESLDPETVSARERLEEVCRVKASLTGVIGPAFTAVDRRMWRRYLLGNPMFLWRVMSERSERRDEPLPELSPVPFEAPLPEPLPLAPTESARRAA